MNPLPYLRPVHRILFPKPVPSLKPACGSILAVYFSTSTHTVTINTTTIRTRNLNLRPPVPSDAPAIAALFRNPLNLQHEPHKPNNPSTAEYERRIAYWVELKRRGSEVWFVVAERKGAEAGLGAGGDSGAKTDSRARSRLSPSANAFAMSQSRAEAHVYQPLGSEACEESGNVVGITSLMLSANISGATNAELAIMIDSAHQRKGSGQQALEAMIEHAFRIGCDEVMMRTLVENAGFCKLVERVGLRESVRKGDREDVERVFRVRRGEWRDIVAGEERTIGRLEEADYLKG